MLKSYKQLSRWYGALEPEADVSTPQQDEAELRMPSDEDGPARYPHYIREEDPDEMRARNEVPADLGSNRSEFTGGWSDWVAGHAPGPDDDYVGPRDGELVQFPWPEDEYDNSRISRAERATRALRQEARNHPSARRARVVAVLVVAVLLLAAATAGAIYLLRSSGDHGAAAPVVPSMQFTAGSVRSQGISDCPTERADRIVRSAEPGGTDSGPDAILAFQYAYYVERSGERVRAVVAPDSNISAAEVIQHGIDTVPVGTTHCVRIQTITENRYSVEVTEYRPGGAPATYNQQTVTTVMVGGRTLIAGIAAG
ncbi:hypothetical protein ACWEO2_10105 [Nocardia sp. NPDC004278]